MDILNKLPLATISFLVVLAVAIYAYLTGDISFEDFAAYGVGANGAGNAIIGEVRNRAGKGTSK